MELDELLALLDIESSSEMKYFEQFADLIEEEQYIPLDTLIAFFELVDSDTLVDLIDGYFEETLNSVPDNENDFFTLLTNICTTLKTLAVSGEDDAVRVFSEEFYKFRSWYLFENRVLCTESIDGEEREVSPFTALTNYRAGCLTDEEYLLDFTEALDYPLDEYVVSLTSILEDDYGDGDLYGEDEDYRDRDDED